MLRNQDVTKTPGSGDTCLAVLLTKIPRARFRNASKSSKSTVGTPEIYDIPLSVTNRLIYSKRGKLESGYKNTRYRYRFGQSRSAMKSRRGVAMKQNGNNKNMSPAASSSIFPTDGLQRIRSLPTR